MSLLNSGQTCLRDFLSSNEDGSFYIGHASILVRISGRKFLIDGVYSKPLFLNSWRFFPELIADPSLLDVDGVFISHFHEDHFDPELLKALKKETPIYIPEDRLGFSEILRDPQLNVQTLCGMQWREISPYIRALSIPVSHNRVDSAIVLQGKNFSVYQGNDACVARTTLQDAHRMTGKIDHAYIPYAYIWWYPSCISSLTDEAKRQEMRRLSRKSMEEGAMIAEVLQASVIVPSGGNLIFCADNDSTINQEITSPFVFADYLRVNFPDLYARLRILMGGDYILKRGDQNVIASAPMTNETYNQKLCAFLQQVHFDSSNASDDQFITDENCLKIAARLKMCPSTNFDSAIYFASMGTQSRAIRVDMKTLDVSAVMLPETDRRFISFKLSSTAFQTWVTGQRDLEHVLNSHQFTVEREPEEFNPEIWDRIRSYF